MSMQEKILRRKMRKAENHKLMLRLAKTEELAVKSTDNIPVESKRTNKRLHDSEDSSEETSVLLDPEDITVTSKKEKKKLGEKDNNMEEKVPKNKSVVSDSEDITVLSKKKKKKLHEKENNIEETVSKNKLVVSDSEDITVSLKKKKKKLCEKENNLEEIVSENDNSEAEISKKKNKKNTIIAKEEQQEPQDVKEESKENGVVENQSPASSLSVKSGQTFASLEGKICERTLKRLKELGYVTMTEIQAKTIPALLEGHHLVGTSKTGSGKTLAFLIPTIDFVYKVGFKPRNGTAAIILSPTRELSMQTYGVLMELMKYHSQTIGLVMGGEDKKKEARKFYNGVNILVATPGRLLYHLKNTKDFMFDSNVCLVIDEADKMLEFGFVKDIKQILSILPTKNRQTILFSATQTDDTEALISLVMEGTRDPLRVHIEERVESLKQGYLELPSDKRLSFLFGFLWQRLERNLKLMVFFSTCMSVVYHQKLFDYFNLSVMVLHGKLDQRERTNTFYKFSNAKRGILFCTDIAARGLDIPAVDWIIQYDPPGDIPKYIHRIGRTARGLGTTGFTMVCLRKEELDFLRYLKKYDLNIIIDEFGVFWDRIDDMQSKTEKLLSEDKTLKRHAIDAYKSYVRTYAAQPLKAVFNMEKLDLKQVAKSFGLKVPPKIY